MHRLLPRYIITLLLSILWLGCEPPRPVSLRIIHDSAGIPLGGRKLLVAEVTFPDHSRVRVPVKWTSERPTVATVDGDGVVTGREEGVASIRATTSGLSEIVPVQVDAGKPLTPGGGVRIHYNRTDGAYAGWGVHYFGDAVEIPTPWESPLLFSGRDAFGVFADIPIANFNASMAIILHKGEEKDGVAERVLAGLSTQKEFWFKEGREEIWTAQPSLLPDFRFAELLSAREVRAVLSGSAPVNMSEISFQNQRGEGVPLASVRQNGLDVFIQLSRDISFADNWSVGFGCSSTWARLSDGLLDTAFLYEGDDLGAELRSDGSARLKLWSPPATAVSVILFDPQDSNRRLGTAHLQRGEKGVWEALLPPGTFGLRTLRGAFYQYEVTSYGNTRLALDPYARSMAAFDPRGSETMGKAAIIDRSVGPAGFEGDQFRNEWIMKSRADMVAYEIHVRDFTISPSSGVTPELRGTYLGFRERIPYLKSLGISHVQLLPIQNFYTVVEIDRAFRSGDAANLNYNWGYDPQNYFTPEGWFSTDARNPESRVRELKALVAALHEAGIGVIVDVVYNHAFKADIFENVCQGCYFRKDSWGRISGGTGAGPSLESRRLMVRKLIVDSLRMLKEEYHVDGFRFDLMGFLDVDTMRAVREALGDDVILHGEAWEFTDLPSHATTKSNLPDGAEIGAFSDTTRDAFSGRMASPGFVQGDTSGNHKVRSAIVGNLRGYNSDYDNSGRSNVNISDDPYDRFARSPLENLGFLTVHDGFTLWDKLNLSYKGSTEERARLARMAYAMLLTSQGRVILHGGDEMARTKPLGSRDPSAGRAHTSPLVTEDEDLPGVRYFHENSYGSPDYTNMVRWSRLDAPVFAGLARYVKGLVELRRAEPLFQQTDTASVNATLRFLGDQETREVDRSIYAGYTSFSEVPSLRLNFVGGPAGGKVYLAGEIYPAGAEKNPPVSRYVVNFDDNGQGSVELSRAEVAGFDLAAWSDPANLQIKAVTVPGQWSVLPGSYSSMGNNVIKPSLILKDNSVEVNLGIIDHAPGVARTHETSTLAFELSGEARPWWSADGWNPAASAALQQAQWGQKSVRQRYVVIHNASPNPERVEVPALGAARDWVVVADDDEVDVVRGVQQTEVKFMPGGVVAPRKSTVILARRGAGG